MLLALRPCLVSDVSLLEVAIKLRLGTLAVTPVAFPYQSLAAVAVLLPVFDAHVIEMTQLPLEHHDPYRCAEESVFDACWFPKRGFGG